MKIQSKKAIVVLVLVISASLAPAAQANNFQRRALTHAETLGLAACANFKTVSDYAYAFDALPKARRLATRTTALAHLQGLVTTFRTSLNLAVAANSPYYRPWLTPLAAISGFASTGNGTPAVESAVANLTSRCATLHRTTGA